MPLLKSKMGKRSQSLGFRGHWSRHFRSIIYLKEHGKKEKECHLKFLFFFSYQLMVIRLAWNHLRLLFIDQRRIGGRTPGWGLYCNQHPFLLESPNYSKFSFFSIVSGLHIKITTTRMKGPIFSLEYCLKHLLRASGGHSWRNSSISILCLFFIITISIEAQENWKQTQGWWFWKSSTPPSGTF